jgi:opacity protein-like surface antigen
MAGGAADWTGLYAGLQIGGAFTAASADYSAPNAFDTDYTTPPVDSNKTGFAIGGNVGFDFALHNLVLGAVADYTFLTGLNENRFGGWPDCSFGSCSPLVHTDANGLITFRGRAGFEVMDGTLLYGTAGIGFLHTSDTMNVTGTAGKGGNFRSSKWAPALIYGAGVEEMLDDGLSVKMEVLHGDANTTTGFAHDTHYFASDLPVYYKHSITLATLGVTFHIH